MKEEPGKMRYWILRKLFGHEMEAHIREYYKKQEKQKKGTLYDSILYTVNDCLASCDDDDEKEIILTYILEALVSDLCGTTQNEGLIYHTRYADSPFPLCYFNGIKEVSLIKGTADIELSQVSLYVRLHRYTHLTPLLMKLRTSRFEYDDTNHMATYFDDLNLCHVYNGNHSIAAGKYYNKGRITAKLVHMNDLYQKFTTDGQEWIEIDSDRRTAVSDYRCAAIFSVAKLRNTIRKQNH